MDKFWDRIIKAGLASLLISVPLFFIYHRQGGYFFSIYGEAKEALAQLLILFLFCTWLLKMNSTGLFRLRHSPLNLPLALFLLLILLSLLWAENPYEGLKFSRRWLAHILLYFIIVNNIKTLKAIRAFMAVMVFTAIAVAAYGIAQYYGWEFAHLYQVLTHNATMGNPNFAGEYLVIVIPLALSLLIYSGRRPLIRKIYYALALILFTSLIVARSRATWVGLIAAITAIFIFSIRKKVFLRALAVNIISIVVVSNIALTVITPALVDSIVQRLPKPKARKYALAPSLPGADYPYSPSELAGTGTPFTPGATSLPEIELPPARPLIEIKPSDPWWIKRFATIFNLTYGTNRQRIEIWKGIIKMVKARPFLGVGIGNFNLIYPAYQREAALATYGQAHFIRQAHNEYLQFAAELGLLGLGLFLWFCLRLLKGLWRKLKAAERPAETIIYLGLLGAILATLVAAGFSFNLQNESSALYFWFIVGMAGVLLK